MRYADKSVVWVVLFVAGCGDSLAVEDTPFVSGERLRAIVNSADGGAELFDGWWDSEAGTRCQFAPADDGTIRCLPGLDTESYRVFLDDQCTQPAYAHSDSNELPRFVADASTEDRCEVTYAIHLRGNRLVDGTATFSRSRLSGECFQRSDRPDALYDLNDAYSPSTFVAATEVRVQRDSQLDAVIRAADDGSSEIVNGFDRLRSFRCWLPPLGRADGFCLPIGDALGFIAGDYADPSCSEPLIYHGPNCGEPLSIALSTRVDSRGEVFEPGAEVAAEEVHFPRAGECVPLTEPRPGRRYFRVGAAVDPASVPALTSIVIGDGAVVAVHVADAGGGVLQGFRFVDTATDLDCYSEVTCDGVKRCIPIQLQLSADEYSDPTCTQPIARHPCSSDLSDSVVTTSATDECHEDATIGALFAAGAPHDQQVYGTDDFGVCVPITPAEGVCYSQLGAEVDATRFGAIVERID